MVLKQLLVTILYRQLLHYLENYSCYGYQSHNSKVQLGISVDTSMNPFFCFLECSISSNFSCDIFLGRDWFNYVSTMFPNAKISLSETEYLDFSVSPRLGVHIDQSVFSLAALIFDGR